MKTRQPPGRMPAYRVILLVAVSLALLAAVGLFGMQVFIRSEVKATGDRAMIDFPGDRVEALASLVECEGCDLKARNRAVWALGQMGNPAALPILRKHHTREKCDHGTKLCQYELGKAIKKIEGTWDLRASFFYEGTDDTAGSAEARR